MYYFFFFPKCLIFISMEVLLHQILSFLILPNLILMQFYQKSFYLFYLQNNLRKNYDYQFYYLYFIFCQNNPQSFILIIFFITFHVIIIQLFYFLLLNFVYIFSLFYKLEFLFRLNKVYFKKIFFLKIKDFTQIFRQTVGKKKNFSFTQFIIYNNNLL